MAQNQNSNTVTSRSVNSSEFKLTPETASLILGKRALDNTSAGDEMCLTGKRTGLCSRKALKGKRGLCYKCYDLLRATVEAKDPNGQPLYQGTVNGRTLSGWEFAVAKGVALERVGRGSKFDDLKILQTF